MFFFLLSITHIENICSDSFRKKYYFCNKLLKPRNEENTHRTFATYHHSYYTWYRYRKFPADTFGTAVRDLQLHLWRIPQFLGFLSYFTGAAIFPSLITPGAPLDEVSEAQGILPYFSVAIPPLMNVMTALVLAFTLGLGLASLHSDALKNVARDFQEIIVRMISAVILPLLPIYIFGIFLNMTHSGQVFSILMVFIKIIGVIFILHIFLLVFQYCIAALFVRKNPFRLLGRMLPAYFTALGTQSSAATIPVTLEQTKKNGVSADIAGFVIPLCATIHLSGSTLKIVACALALMMMQGMPFDFSLFAGFIFMLGITMIAAPGVPGGAIMASLGILQSMLGFDESAQALMIALYIAMDSFGTACNVTGDGAIALIIDKIMGKRKTPESL